MEESRSPKLGYKETRELEELPAKIGILEKEQTDITLRLSSPDVYCNDSANARALHQRFAALEEELIQHLTRWEELEAKQAAGHKRIR
jgi:ATP-binding cassette subfamily F protein uup